MQEQFLQHLELSCVALVLGWETANCMVGKKAWGYGMSHLAGGKTLLLEPVVFREIFTENSQNAWLIFH